MAQFEYKGIDIDVNHNGNFVAQIDGAELSHPMLIELQRQIDAEIKANLKGITIALPVTGIVADGRFDPVYRTAQGTITGIHRHTGGLIISGVEQNWRWVLPDNETTRQLCAEFVAVLNRHTVLVKSVERLQVRSPAAGRVATDAYASAIALLTKRYQAAVAPPPEVIGEPHA